MDGSKDLYIVSYKIIRVNEVSALENGKLALAAQLRLSGKLGEDYPKEAKSFITGAILIGQLVK